MPAVAAETVAVAAAGSATAVAATHSSASEDGGKDDGGLSFEYSGDARALPPLLDARYSERGSEGGAEGGTSEEARAGPRCGAPSERSIVRFVACGDLSAFDADRSYGLSVTVDGADAQQVAEALKALEAHGEAASVGGVKRAAPIDPPYAEARRRMRKTDV